MAIKVFVSVGTPADESQRAFRDAVLNAIELSGLSPRLVGERDWDYRNPLRGIRRAMDDCRGAIVISYARYRFDSGVELRKDGIRSLQETTFPTVWNQIEAAMAYERGFPLLVVAQNGLRQDAFFESTNDVRPFWADLDSGIGHSEGFHGYLRGWKQDVEEFAAATDITQRQRSPQEITIGQIVSSLPWYELMALLATIVSVLVATATIGYRLGSGQWPLG